MFSHELCEREKRGLPSAILSIHLALFLILRHVHTSLTTLLYVPPNLAAGARAQSLNTVGKTLHNTETVQRGASLLLR